MRERNDFVFNFSDKKDGAQPTSLSLSRRQKDDGVEDLTEDVDSGTDDEGGSKDFGGLHNTVDPYKNKKGYATQYNLSDVFDEKDKQHNWKDRAFDSGAR